MADFKHVLLLLCLFYLNAQPFKSSAISPDSGYQKGTCIAQKHEPLLDLENTSGTPGILQALKLYERSFAGPVTLKLSKKTGIPFDPKKVCVHTAAYFKSYHSRRINNLGPVPLYISVRSIII